MKLSATDPAVQTMLAMANEILAGLVTSGEVANTREAKMAAFEEILSGMVAMALAATR